jgi:TonB family protein
MAGVVTQLKRGNLCFAFRAPEANSDSEAWKKKMMMGNMPVCTRLEMLPQGQPRWSALLASTIFQIVATAFVIFIPALFPDKLVNKNFYEAVSVIAVQTDVAPPREQPVVDGKIVRAHSAFEEPLQPQRAAKLTASRPLVPDKAEFPRIATVDIPPLSEFSAEVRFEAPVSQPSRPGEPVKTGTLANDSAASAVINKPLRQVQTGGFGDPNGLPGDNNSNKHANVAHSGFPTLLPGPEHGNGIGDANGVRGTIASAGFGDGAASSPASGVEGTRGAVKPGGFETAAPALDAARPKKNEAPTTLQPVVILEKPNPTYSDEARKLGLEGEVLVEVIFPASGPVQVIQVTSGLGHGLDEAAIRAAQQIRFKPALQDGKPVDFRATLHIEFRLAF